MEVGICWNVATTCNYHHFGDFGVPKVSIHAVGSLWWKRLSGQHPPTCTVFVIFCNVSMIIDLPMVLYKHCASMTCACALRVRHLMLEGRGCAWLFYSNTACWFWRITPIRHSRTHRHRFAQRMQNDLTRLAGPAVQDTGRREAVAPVLIALAGLSGGQPRIFSVCCFIMLCYIISCSETWSRYVLKDHESGGWSAKDRELTSD